MKINLDLAHGELTREAAAHYLGITPTTLMKRTKAGRVFPTRYTSGRPIYRVSELNRHAENHKDSHITMSEAATLIGVPRRTLQTWVRRGDILYCYMERNQWNVSVNGLTLAGYDTSRGSEYYYPETFEHIDMWEKNVPDAYATIKRERDYAVNALNEANDRADKIKSERNTLLLDNVYLESALEEQKEELTRALEAVNELQELRFILHGIAYGEHTKEIAALITKGPS